MFLLVLYPPLFWGWILLILRSPKGGCCSISDDLSCSYNIFCTVLFHLVYTFANSIWDAYLSMFNGCPYIFLIYYYITISYVCVPHLYDLRFGWLLVLSLYKEDYLHIFKCVSFWSRDCCGYWEGWALVNRFIPISWMAVITPTDRPKSVLNCYVIEVFSGVFVLSCCFLDYSVGVGAFVIRLSQISSLFSFTDRKWLS